MIAFERLAALALGELSEGEAHAVEDHVLGCDACAAVLEQLLELGHRVADITRAGAAFFLAGPALVDRLEQDHKVTRTYRVSPGGEVACTVDAGDIYTAVHFAVDTRGVKRLDLVHESPSGTYRIGDVPFDPEAGEVVFVHPGDYLRTLPSERKTLRLIAVDGAGERVVGEYMLDHTAFTP